jgi:hypothetical protein
MPSCPLCLNGKTTVEIAGRQFHTLSDRWISCSGADQQQRVIVPARGELMGRMRIIYQSICESSVIRQSRRFYTPRNS